MNTFDLSTESSLRCIDIGANLVNKRFSKDVDKVIEAARLAGVEKIVVTGSSESNSIASAALCERYPGYLYSTAGIHPHEARQFCPERTQAVLERLLGMGHVVAVGECGLDFNRDFSPREDQRNCFAAQLALAAKCGLPMFLHERDAFDEFCSMIREQRDSIQAGVVHCFTGTSEQARAYLDLDLHIGVTGWICDERRGQRLRDVVRCIPVERLMIETDCPYLAPRDHRPRINRNEPKYLLHILKVVADCRNEDPAELAGKLFATTGEFFGIA